MGEEKTQGYCRTVSCLGVTCDALYHFVCVPVRPLGAHKQLCLWVDTLLWALNARMSPPETTTTDAALLTLVKMWNRSARGSKYSKKTSLIY